MLWEEHPLARAAPLIHECLAAVAEDADHLVVITDANGVLLIYDEVMTGFRLHLQGAQGLYGIAPDLTTLGKVIGGGLPVGAFGGRRDIMDFYDPRKGGPRISQGGTFNANPVTMAAGVATLNVLTPEAYTRLDALGERLRGGISRLFSNTRRKGQVTGVGSLSFQARGSA